MSKKLLSKMKVQSNGMGQQSVAMYLMSSLDILPRLDYSIFADPGAERRETYLYLAWLKKWQKQNNGIPLIHDRSKNLYKDLLKKSNSTGHRFASIPSFTESGGMVRRQCTNEYKIMVVDDNIRKLQGKEKGQSFDPVEIWMGISLDEMDRINGSHRKNVTKVFPFCGYSHNGKLEKLDIDGMTRGEINKWMTEMGYKIPVASSCTFCPFHTDSEWQEIKNNPSDFRKAVKIDRVHRDMSQRGLKDKLYLHRSLKPLDEVDFTKGQYEIGYDCYGYCGA